jgi:hypothetical protein
MEPIHNFQCSNADLYNQFLQKEKMLLTQNLMKNQIFRQSLLFFFCLLTSSIFLLAQAPQGIPYQAIARNASGVAISNTAVKVRFSIRDSIATGAIKYQETHNPTTSALGLFSVNVGMGIVVSGTFSGINWGKNAKFLQVELDPAGGANFTDLGTTQMMSVPYALFAGSISSLESNGNSKATNKIGYTTSGTWTCPANVFQIIVELWGGGGGGGGALAGGNNYVCTISQGGKGGDGGYTKAVVNVNPGTSYTITVGNGGSGAGWYGGYPNDGAPGGSSSFGGILSAPGGGSGLKGSCTGLDGANGAITNFTYQQTLETRSYIPSGFVQIVPGNKAPGGIGGYAAYSGGAIGQSGEAGFVAISY